MKNLFLTIVMTLIWSFVIGTAVGIAVNINPLIPTGALFLMHFVPMNFDLGAAYDPLLQIKFAKDIQEQLYPDNSFYKNSFDDSGDLTMGTVRRPVAGDDPEAETNPTTYPLSVSERSDTNSDYDVDFHTTKPQFVRINEEMMVSYAKRQSIIRSHVSVLNTKVADGMVYAWLPSLATNFVRTSGANAAATAPGATGNRKAITKDDFIDACTILDRMDVDGNRYALVPADLYGQLLKIDDFIDYNKTGRADMLAKGVIGEIAGVQIYKRSRSGIYTNASTPVKKAPGAATATSDNQAVLIWSDKMVYRAEGAPQVVIGQPNPEYAGATLFNANCYAGGKMREDQKGVVAIIQTT
jgi:hypothetical protein